MSKNLQLVMGFMTITVILSILSMGLFARPENLAQAEMRINEYTAEHYVSKDSFSMACQTMQDIKQDIKDVKADVKVLLRKK